ncbi:MAG TPA: Yip1 family protein [Anaerolineales bacterium]|nr:Yip1 family protein [Anaerolineales bacterium]
MNEPTNAPMLPPPSGFSEWVTVWRDALTRPSDETFARIAQSPNAKLTTALLWVFLGSLVNFFLVSLVQGRLMNQMMQNSDLGIEGFPQAGGGLMTAICGAPIGAVISTVLFALAVGIVQVIAKMFGGRGTYDQLAYAIAAIVTPFNLVSAGLTLLAAIPFVGACFGILGLFAGLYVLVLEIMAVKGVNQFGWGPAAASLLLPVFAIACCVAVAVGSIITMLAPEFMDTFNTIMTPVP